MGKRKPNPTYGMQIRTNGISGHINYSKDTSPIRTCYRKQQTTLAKKGAKQKTGKACNIPHLTGHTEVLLSPLQAAELGGGLDHPQLARPLNLWPQALLVPPFLTKNYRKLC